MSAVDPFSEFSKGAVVCKYSIVEHVGNHRLRGNVGGLLMLAWLIGWIFMPPLFVYPWINAMVAALPMLLGGPMMRIAFPYREVGLLTFKESTMEFTRNGEEPWRVDLHDLKSMTIEVSIASDFSRYGRRFARAYKVSIQQGDRTHAYNVLNEMHLTAADRTQFMAIPPTLGNTLRTFGDRYRIRFYDTKGRESGLI